MRCTITGCPGVYEDRRVVHTVRPRARLIVIDHVPAEVCDVCGDVLFRPETIRHIEELVNRESEPSGTVPLYEYA